MSVYLPNETLIITIENSYLQQHTEHLKINECAKFDLSKGRFEDI